MASLSTKRVIKSGFSLGGTTLGQGTDTRREHEWKQSTAPAVSRVRVAACRGITKGNFIETTTNLERKTDDDGCIISRARGSRFLHVLQVRLRKNEPFLDPDTSKCLFLCSSGTHTHVCKISILFFPTTRPRHYNGQICGTCEHIYMCFLYSIYFPAFDATRQASIVVRQI